MDINTRLATHLKVDKNGAIVITKYDNLSLVFRYGVGLVMVAPNYEIKIALRGMGCYDVGDGTRELDKRFEPCVRRFAQEYDNYVELEQAMNIALDALRDKQLKRKALYEINA